jgi:hypothetical protein
MKLPRFRPSRSTGGHSVVIQLVSTAEAMLDRRLADLSPDERADLARSFPREYIMLSSTLHIFFAVAVYVERGGGRRRFPSVFHDFTPDNMRVRGCRGRVRPAFERR